MRIKSSASFPEGFKGSLDVMVSLAVVNEIVAGKKIVKVEYPEHNVIRFILDDGNMVSMEPCGLEGDDLELTIESQN